MNLEFIPSNDYLLLTPGPLSTTKSVRAAMLKDLCTWDDDYKNLVQDLRAKLLSLFVGRNPNSENYTTALMQGSGTFIVESVLGSTFNKESDKIIVLCNGVYGERISQICQVLKYDFSQYNVGEMGEFDTEYLDRILSTDGKFTHLAVVHCETTTGALNNIEAIGQIAQKHKLTYIVDAMSSLGGIEIDIPKLDADFLISSSNKCIQGVPGFGFVIAKKESLKKCEGLAKSLSLDLYDQWLQMEKDPGKWRFTSPTHVVRAFYQALMELEEEGGVIKRAERYRSNHAILLKGMRELGFELVIPEKRMSPIITSFMLPNLGKFSFRSFYYAIKSEGFVIYPGKVTNRETFRIGNIGNIFPEDMERLISVISKVMNSLNDSF